jgi:hypothetical protein
MAIAAAEPPAPNLLAMSAIEIPISRLKKQAISTRTLRRNRNNVTTRPMYTKNSILWQFSEEPVISEQWSVGRK